MTVGTASGRWSQPICSGQRSLIPLLAVGSPDLLWLLYLVRAATGVVGLIFDPAESALLPRLVGEEQLVSANALNALNNNLGRLVGPASAGCSMPGAGFRLWSLSTRQASLFRPRSSWPSGPMLDPGAKGSSAERVSAWGRMVSEWRAGLRLVGRDRALATIFIAVGLGFVGEGTFSVGFTPLVIDVLDGGAAGAGVLSSAQAVGGLLAGAMVARVALIVSPRTLFAGGMIGLGLTDLGLANAATLARPGPGAIMAGSVFMLLAGFPVVAAFATQHGLLQSLTVDDFRGRVFGALGAIQGMATLIGLALGGVAIDAVGVVPVLSFGAAMWVIGGLFALQSQGLVAL